MPVSHNLHLRKKDLRAALQKAEDDIRITCETREIGSGCVQQCKVGGMIVIGRMYEEINRVRANEGMGMKKIRLAGGKLGIIVSPMEDCPKGFEEIVVRGGKNPRVKICRLDENHRKKWAPKGKPAHKGALRRKTKPRYLPGVTTRDIREG